MLGMTQTPEPTAPETIASIFERRLHDFTIVDSANLDDGDTLHVAHHVLMDGVYHDGLFNLRLPWSVSGGANGPSETLFRVHVAADLVEHFAIDENGKVTGGKIKGIEVLAPPDPDWTDVEVTGLNALPTLSGIWPAGPVDVETIHGTYTEIVMQVRSVSTAYTTKPAV